MTIRVLIVDDSRLFVRYLTQIIGTCADLEIVATAVNGVEAISMACKHRPNVILMDLNLPTMNGIEAIKQIMIAQPCPIVVLSAYLDDTKTDKSFEALSAGAVEVLRKPVAADPEDSKLFKDKLNSTIRLMSSASVVRRWDPNRHSVTKQVLSRKPKLIAIGSSTGGPAVLRELLEIIPRPFPVPICISQHIISGFEVGFANWLAESGHDVKVARHGEYMEGGRVYLSPADAHMVVYNNSINIIDAEDQDIVPSIDRLFESVAEHFGPRALGIILTGMGSDGCQGMLTMKRAGAVTLAQEFSTCTIDSMPRRAFEHNATSAKKTPAQIALLLSRLAHKIDQVKPIPD